MKIDHILYLLNRKWNSFWLDSALARSRTNDLSMHESDAQPLRHQDNLCDRSVSLRSIFCSEAEPLIIGSGGETPWSREPFHFWASNALSRSTEILGCDASVLLLLTMTSTHVSRTVVNKTATKCSVSPLEVTKQNQSRQDRQLSQRKTPCSSMFQIMPMIHVSEIIYWVRTKQQKPTKTYKTYRKYKNTKQ